MWAAVENGNGCAVALTEQKHRLIQDAAMKERPRFNLGRPGRLVPGVPKVARRHHFSSDDPSLTQTHPCSMLCGTGSRDCPRHAPCMHTPVSGSKWAPWP